MWLRMATWHNENIHEAGTSKYFHAMRLFEQFPGITTGMTTLCGGMR
jgi:hypothetical protein